MIVMEPPAGIETVGVNEVTTLTFALLSMLEVETVILGDATAVPMRGANINTFPSYDWPVIAK